MSCANVPSGSDEKEGEPAVMMPRRKKVNPVDKNTCQRCKVARSRYVMRSTTYCASCFQINVYIRLIRQLHPPLLPERLLNTLKPKDRVVSRPPVQDGTVLIALSGGAGSMAMLDILCSRGYIGHGEQHVADKTKGEKDVVWNRGMVVYVEFAGVIQGSLERTEEIRKIAEERGLGFVELRAEDVFDAGLAQRLSGGTASLSKSPTPALSVNLFDRDLPLLDTPTSSTSTPLEQLQSLLASLPVPSRPSLLSDILSSLLNLAAQTIPGISHLLLGETATRQAQRVISGTASGRGWQLPLDMAGSSEVPPLPTADGVEGEDRKKILKMKPMKEVTIKEAALYCRLQGLESMNDRRWDLAGPSNGLKSDLRGSRAATSLEMLTEQFIAGLSVTHPSTVSTIIRTGDKLVFPGADTSILCPVCEMPVDPSALSWKAQSALTTLPTADSTLGIDNLPPSDGSSLAALLCYSCLTTFTPTTLPRDQKGIIQNITALPYWVSSRISQRTAVSRSAMKAEIEEFLISDGEGE